MLFMLFLGLRVDDKFINQYDDKRVKVFMEDPIHEIHKCSRCIRETKLHNEELIVTITGMKDCLWDISFSNTELMYPERRSIFENKLDP